MNILVLGATGPTGREVMRQALAAGHRVTAFVRDPAKLSGEGGIRVVQGDPASTAELDAVLPGHDAVVSALGRRASFRSERLIIRCMRALAPAMERRGVRRLVLVSAFGVGESRRHVPPLMRLLQGVLLRDIFADKARAERYLRSRHLDCTFVYPTALTNGPLTGKYRAGERLALRGFPKISRADVAHFVLAALASSAWVGKTVVVSY